MSKATVARGPVSRTANVRLVADSRVWDPGKGVSENNDDVVRAIPKSSFP
jgi:hypothetical protein